MTRTRLGGPLRKPWKNAIAVGRAYELLRQDLLDHLSYLQREVGYRYCRFHALFHDDVGVVTKAPDGSLVYQWHQVDKIYDALLQRGLKPFVELNPMPSALASGDQKMFWYQMNVTPPSDYQAWEELVFQFAKHCVDRYGTDEVRQWYFEVWNEPNLSGFWSGTQEDYFKLYDASAKALKRVDANLRVGGPSSSKASWLEDTIEHCKQAGTSLDFITTHLYPQDEYVEYEDRKGSPHEIGAFFTDTVRRARERVSAASSEDMPIHWTEWNPMSASSTASISWSENATNDSLYAASFVTQACLQLDEAADSLCFWVASDLFEEGGMPHSPFSCTYGLLTVHGIPKASCNAFRLLNRLRGDQAEVTGREQLAPGQGLSATRDGDRVTVLVYNHRPLEILDHPQLVTTLRIDVETDEPQVAIASHVAEGHGSAWQTWHQLGRPQNLSPEEERLLRAHAEPRLSVHALTPKDGSVEIPVQLGANELLCIELRPRGATSVGKGAGSVDLEVWDRLMGERSR